MEYLIIGYIATTIAIVMYVPQTLKVLKEKKCDHVNIATFFIISNGALLWSLATSLQSTPNLPGYFANAIIAILTLPIIYYYFIKNKKIFYLWLIWVIICLTPATMFVIFSISIHDAFTTILVILAGMSTGFGFIPQSWKVFKEKKIGDISKRTIYLVIIANFIWILYYILRFIYDKGTSTASWYMSCIFTVFSFLTPIPIILFEKNKSTI